MSFTTARARDDLLRIDDRRHLQVRRGGRHQIEDLPLLGFLRIADVQLQHEAVELRFGQLIGAFLLERILRRQHEERIGQRIGRFADRDLPFLHRFEQRALHLGRRAIDFVGQDQVGEDRAELRRELAGARIVDQRADQIGRQQIGRELQALEAGLNAGRQRFHGQRLGQPGHAFEQDVAVREQAEQKPIDQIFLADDDVANLLAQRRNPLPHFLHLLRDFLRRFHKKG